MSPMPQRTRLRLSTTEPRADALPFLLRQDDACRQMLARCDSEPAVSTAALRRRAQEICLTLAAGAQMEEEPYYRARCSDRGTSL